MHEELTVKYSDIFWNNIPSVEELLTEETNAAKTINKIFCSYPL